jgi:hypothetical protein
MLTPFNRTEAGIQDMAWIHHRCGQRAELVRIFAGSAFIAAWMMESAGEKQDTCRIFQ